MGSIRSSRWPLILVLLKIQLVKVQGIDHASQKLRRLNEQFQQFQALTQARLDMLALNQNRNSSRRLESHVQTLNDHYHHMSQDLEHLKQSTMQEIESLREWSRKLEKKNKRLEGRLSLVERNLRESHCLVQIPKSEPSQDLLNLTLEFHSQEERLAALQVQRDELLVGVKGLQESLKKQVQRVTQLESRLGDVLQWTGGGNVRSVKMVEALSSTARPQEYYEPRRKTQTHRGNRPGRILGGHTQHRLGGVSQHKNASRSQAKPYQYLSTNQPKHSKVQKPRPQPDPHPQTQDEYTNLKSQVRAYIPQPDPYHPQSQIQVQVQTRPYPIQQEQHQSSKTVPYHQTQMLPQVQLPSQPPSHPQRQPQLHNPSHPSWSQPHSKAQAHPEPTKNKQDRTKGGAPQPQASDFLPQPQSESYETRASRWKGEEEKESDTKIVSVIHNLLQLPVRHKIPAQPVTKKDSTICNVDSMLFFPSASAENYVTFSLTLPDLSEFTVCLWLRVEASHVGTLLSYATDDSDNQLVLYGQNSSASSVSFPGSSSHTSYSSSLFSSSSISVSSPSLDLVIGDPVYRRFPVSLLLDARWHHLCILWSSIQGRFWHYNDRRLTSSGSNFRKGWEIPGGGSVVLGQEQDYVGGGFDAAEGFAGQMAGFRVWNRVLSTSEVEGVAEGRGVPRGVVLGMEDIKEVHGEVQQVACECLEHCV